MKPIKKITTGIAVAVTVATGGVVAIDTSQKTIPLQCDISSDVVTDLNEKLKTYKIDEGLAKTREINSDDKAKIKGCQIAKTIKNKTISERIQSSGNYTIEIVEANPLETGVEIYARVWENGKQLGFGPQMDVDIERFLIYNPPVLTQSDTGDIIASSTDPDGNLVITKYKEDPYQSIIESLAYIVDSKNYKSSTTTIKAGSIGETTSVVYPNEDRNITSGNPTLNRDLNPQYIQRNSGDAYRSLIDFTFPADPGGETIDSVTVSLIHNSQSGTHTTVDVHEITKSGFNLLTTTWNTYNGSNSWTTAGGDFGGVMDSVTPGTGTKTWNVYGPSASNDIAAAWSTTFHFIFKYTNDTTSPASNWWGHYASEQTGTSNDPFVTIESSVASGGARRIIRTVQW